MKQFILVILLTICVGCSAGQVRNTQDCTKLNIATEFYYSKHWCATERCNDEALEERTQIYEQCMQGLPVKTETRTFMTNKDITLSAAGMALGIATGFGYSRQHVIEVYKFSHYLATK